MQIRFNWAAILAFVVFWSYGFYGAVSFPLVGFWSVFGNVVVSIYVLVVFGVLLKFAYKNSVFSDSITFSWRDILVFLSYFVILFAFSYGDFMHALQGDQIAHAQESMRHGMSFFTLLHGVTNYFDAMPYFSLIWIFNILLLLFAGGVLFVMRKRGFWWRFAVFSLFFLLFRFVVVYLGGSFDIHPPFRLFPLWTSATLFSLQALSFRFVQFLVLLLMMLAIQKVVIRKFSFVSSWFFALVVGSIPVLWHTGILVEFSVYTAALWTILLLSLIVDFDEFLPPSLRWFCLITLISFIRLPALIAFVPLILCLGIGFLKSRKYNVETLLCCALLLLALAPLVLKSLMLGTGATYVSSAVDLFPAGTSTIGRVWFAFQSGIFWDVVVRTFLFPWYLFLFFAFVPLLRKSKERFLVIFLFFVVAVYFFYSIKPQLWGTGRYQAEYLFPFVTLGLFVFLLFLKRISSHFASIFPLLFLPLIAYNFYFYGTLAERNLPVDERLLTYDSEPYMPTPILSEHVYDFDRAFAEVREGEFAGSTYVAGVTYGVFNEILAHFSLAEVLLTGDIIKFFLVSQDGWIPDVALLHENTDVRLVLITDAAIYGVSPQQLRLELEERGWVFWKRFVSERHGSTIIGMVRSDAS